MKVINDFGSRFQGTIGKQMTASTWKGRNYLKKYTKPANPDTTAQKRVRGYFAAAVALWKTLTSAQKDAYRDKTRADKTNISAFNTMVSSYVKILEAGDVYTAPSVGNIIVKDSVTTDPIEGVEHLVRKTGQSTDYQIKFTAADGTIIAAICNEDENYDRIVSATGYTTQTTTDMTAEQVWHADMEILLVAE